MDALITNIKNDREETTACHYEMEARINKTEPNSGEEETAVNRNEIPNEVVEVHPLRTCQSETAASQEATKTEPDPGTMQSVEEHQEIPKEDAAVKPVGGLSKRRTDRNLAAGRRQKPKRRIQANCESKRRSAAACRKVFRRARVAWRKRNVVRRIETEKNYGPRKRLTVTGRKATSRATVAWHSENVVRKDCASDQAQQGTPKQRKDGEGLWKFPECNNGKRDQEIKQKLHSRMRTKDLAGRLPLCPRNERTFSWTCRKTIDSMKIAQQIAEILRKIRRLKVTKGTARSTVDIVVYLRHTRIVTSKHAPVIAQ
jgi:hypothetical protein